MKFNCGPSPEARREARRAQRSQARKRLENWHPHFALLPCRVSEEVCIWLEPVERKGLWGMMGHPLVGYYWGWKWQFRAVQPGSKS